MARRVSHRQHKDGKAAPARPAAAADVGPSKLSDLEGHFPKVDGAVAATRVVVAAARCRRRCRLWRQDGGGGSNAPRNTH